MIATQIIPGAERELKNHTSFRMTISNSLTMAYRSLRKVRRTPEQLFDVTLQPVIFTLMFTYIFGGAIAGNVHNYLPIVIPGILIQTVITASMVTGVQLREDMDKGVFNRFKVHANCPDRPTGGSAASRYYSLWHCYRSDIRYGLYPWLSPRGWPRRCFSRWPSRYSVCMVY